MQAVFFGGFMSERKKIIKFLLIFFSLSIAYYLLFKLTGFAIPCFFRRLTGNRLQCPGCGVSRMCISIIKGDFSSAFKYNPCILLLLPFWIVIVGIKLIFEPKCLKNNERFFNVLCWITVIILLIFGIVRNIINL